MRDLVILSEAQKYNIFSNNKFLMYNDINLILKIFNLFIHFKNFK
jgi:hypothetical protein